MTLNKDYLWFEHELAINGLTDFLVGSHLEAAASEHQNAIVFIPDEETGKFDVYLIGKKDGVFTEYVCWVADEFEEDPELIYTVIKYVLAGFKGPKSIEENLKDFNNNLNFYDYPIADHADIYAVMSK